MYATLRNRFSLLVRLCAHTRPEPQKLALKRLAFSHNVQLSRLPFTAPFPVLNELGLYWQGSFHLFFLFVLRYSECYPKCSCEAGLCDVRGSK